MWQRIQTVFLAIAIVSLVMSVFFPIWVLREGQQHHELYALHLSSIDRTSDDGARESNYYPYCITAILFVASITLAVVEVSKYRDRLLQIKLGALNSLFLAGGLIAAVYFATALIKEHGGGQYGLGLWLPGVAVVANWLAMRFIRRDEKLVRDSQRLR